MPTSSSLLAPGSWLLPFCPILILPLFPGSLFPRSPLTAPLPRSPLPLPFPVFPVSFYFWIFHCVPCQTPQAFLQPVATTSKIQSEAPSGGNRFA